MTTRVGGSVVAIALALAGCHPPPEEVGVTMMTGAPSFGVDRPVHAISVARCNPALADCDKTRSYHGYCSFDASNPVWETAMGVHTIGRFDDTLRGAPAIVGPIDYGKLPTNAGWQSPAKPLVEGERYAINLSVYEACDERDVRCVHTKAAGCLFFTIQGGVPVELPST